MITMMVTNIAIVFINHMIMTFTHLLTTMLMNNMSLIIANHVPLTQTLNVVTIFVPENIVTACC